MNIFVGNLSYEVNEEDLKQTFSAHGAVTSASIIMDRATGRSRGFGFVEMTNKAEGDAAIKALNLTELKGRAMTVNEARPRAERGHGGGAGGGGGGGSRGGYGGGGGGGSRRREW